MAFERGQEKRLIIPGSSRAVDSCPGLERFGNRRRHIKLLQQLTRIPPNLSPARWREVSECICRSGSFANSGDAGMYLGAGGIQGRKDDKAIRMIEPSSIPLISTIVLASILLAISACESEEAVRVESGERLGDAGLGNIPVGNPAERGYRFGFDLRSSPKEDARQTLPFLKYLARATDIKLGLSFTPANENIVDRLRKGEVHFAAIGAGGRVLGGVALGSLRKKWTGCSISPTPMPSVCCT